MHDRNPTWLTYCLLPVCLGILNLVSAAQAQSPPRPFVVFDAANRGSPAKRPSDSPSQALSIDASSSLPLQLHGACQWSTSDSALQFAGGWANSEAASKAINTLLRRANGLSVELWLKPASLAQKGPARILTISRGTSHRNLTIGQEGDSIAVRLRTTQTSENGLPQTETRKGVLTTKWTHLVFTWSSRDKARIYVDGRESFVATINGTLDNWDTNFQLILGDEAGGGRAWKGSLRRVALFHEPLNPDEVATRFGHGPESHDVKVNQEQLRQSRLFEQSIAPLLADRCLECHDSANREGGLDLSREKFAWDGGDSGPAIVGGNAAASRLWQVVDADEMPADRAPLNVEEKALLAEWINSGGKYTLDFVDPALYQHGGGDSKRWLQRLTVPEYIATVKAAVGVDISDEALRLLPKDQRADGFSNTAYNMGVDLAHVEAYSQLAAIIVSKMDVLEFADQFSKKRKFTDNDVGELISKMGHWLLRGPLDEEEVIIFRGISTTVASSGGTYGEAVELILQAMLQSPRFVYRIEYQTGGGGRWPVSQYELANRLSYILWGGPPDKELLDAAETGKLSDAAFISEQADRMLQLPAADQQGRQFASEWLNLRGLDNLQPDAERFPGWSAELAIDMRAETIAYFQYVALDKDLPLARLLNYPVTFASQPLAKHYRIEGNGQLTKSLWKDSRPQYQFDLQASSRGGILTQGSVLTIGGDNASMVTRGLFVLHDLLRGVVKDPPPCVNTTPVPTRPGLTQRSIAFGRIESDACGGCHSRFEPLAFGLEQFDGLGTFRRRDEHGNELREDGEILIPGELSPIEYETTRQLMDALAQSTRVQESITWKLTQFALSRPLGAADAQAISEIHRKAQADGGTYRSTMRAIVTSDLVRLQSSETLDD